MPSTTLLTFVGTLRTVYHRKQPFNTSFFYGCVGVFIIIIIITISKLEILHYDK